MITSIQGAIRARSLSVRSCTAGANFAAAAMFAAAMAGVVTSTASAQLTNVIIPDGYHEQITNHWCAAASMEMMLDCPAVLGTNPNVAGLIAAGDGNTVPANGGDPPAFTNGMGQVNAGEAQAFIYGLVHGTNTVNNIGWYNPYTPVGVGTDNNSIAAGLNLLDNPNVVAQGTSTHQYASFNLYPNLAGATIASRTIANALSDYNVPAEATVESGAHAICVYGVSANGMPGNGNAYTINGFFVHDPWTGYAVSQGIASNLQSWGLGWNTYLRYGYDYGANGALTTLPNGNSGVIRLAAWFNYFNPSGPQAAAGAYYRTANVAIPTFTGGSYMYQYGYKFTAEPQGPESLDTGNLGSDNSLVGTAEGTELTGNPATNSALDTALLQDAEDNIGGGGSETGDDSGLDSTAGFTIPSDFDTKDATFMMMPGDTSGEGDWLVPYDGSGGINDVTGGIMIDADTGLVDEATWLDATDNGGNPLSLAQLDQMFQDQANGVDPNDFEVPVPEPTTLSLLVMGGAGLLGRRRR